MIAKSQNKQAFIISLNLIKFGVIISFIDEIPHRSFLALSE
jgi:hypothetical protein